jgi:4-hydroxyphenylacetate 3-monooxygenase
VAGYTGRDREAVQAHIDELAEQGIAPPPTVPMFYELVPSLLTADKDVTVDGPQTSGEVEPVYARVGGRWYLGVGSDHTDRHLEQSDVLESKAACIKPVGTTWVALPPDVLAGGFDEQFDAIEATSWVDGTVYQQGTLSGLRPPSDVLSRLFETLGRDDDADLLVFGGTLPLLTGAFAFGTTWRLQLTLGTGATVEHEYTVTVTN